jgi:hypothetical protein
MRIKSARIVHGNFRCRELGPGGWQFSTGRPGEAELYVSGAAPGAAQFLRDAQFESIECRWREDGVLLTLNAPDASRVLKARNALIHEPLMQLYAGLPLVSFDAAARRFWRRVFRLVRVPGGRLLLGFIARRRRASP